MWDKACPQYLKSSLQVCSTAAGENSQHNSGRGQRSRLWTARASTTACEQARCCQANPLGWPRRSWFVHQALRASHQTPVSAPAGKPPRRHRSLKRCLQALPHGKLVLRKIHGALLAVESWQLARLYVFNQTQQRNRAPEKLCDLCPWRYW